jgi:proprotein convertase subtilisin/kexin type 5
MIQNECITCDRLSTFNGTDCICNRGYFGTRNSCSPCFSSCGTCSGPNFNHCLTCADVTFVFRNNSCFRQNQCPQGLYLSSNSSCTSCATYCSNCTSNTDCSQCISGFNLQSLTYAGVKASFCV